MWGINTPQSTSIRLLVVAISFAFIGMLAVESLRYVDKKRDKKYPKEEHFSVSLVHASIGGPQFAYKSQNNYLYFIDVLLIIDLVNKSNVFYKINTYYAQILMGDKWTNLGHISFSSEGQFYILQDIPTKKGAMIDFDVKTIEEQMKNNLEPGKTVTGVMMFSLNDSDRIKYNISKPSKIKLVVIDSLHNKEEHILDISNQKHEKEEQGYAMMYMPIKIIKTDIDLKLFKIANDY